MNSPQAEASLTISSSKTHVNCLPDFFRWNVLFSQLPNRPFFLGVGTIVIWLLLLWLPMHWVHVYIDHTLGRIVPRSPLHHPWMEVGCDYIIVAPLLETWLFLKCIFTVARWVKLLPRHSRAVIVFSAVLFGLDHFYSVGYIIYTFPLGCLFGSAYFYGGGTRRTFWIVAVAHGTFNGWWVLMAMLAVHHPFGIW